MSDEYTYSFTVDNQLLSEIGERLVTRNYIALAELIKNAYDADAHRVEVKLNTRAKDGGQIIVRDFGDGMTAEEVQTYWMRVATDNKVRSPVSKKYGRKKSGSKGIGRFACRRLAQHLELKSVARAPEGNGYEVTRMSFNWRDLKPGKELAKETFRATVTRVDKAEPGVTLTMSKLLERWTQRDFDILRRSLVDVSVARPEQRKGYKPDPGFVIDLTGDKFETKDATLSEQFLNAGWGRLKTSVGPNGRVELHLSSKRKKEATFRLPGNFKRCANVEVDISWIPGDKSYLRDSHVINKEVRKQLEETAGGVKVYLDGFRVYPYGESGTDWLDISRRLARRIATVDKMFAGVAKGLGVEYTRALLDHPKETTLVGKVVIPASASDNFIIKMDREGFVENEAFFELKRLIQLALEWMTVHYTDYKQRHNEEKLADEAAELHSLTKLENETAKPSTLRTPEVALNTALALVEKAGTKGPEALPGGGRALSAAANIIRRSTSVMDAKLAKLQILASSGPLVFAFAHEIKSLIARLGTHANQLERVAKSVGGSDGEHLSRLADEMRETRARLDQEVGLFGTFARSLEEDEPKKRPLRPVVNEVTSGLSFLAETYEIEVDVNDVDETAKSPSMRTAELYSIVVNLYSNALKSCMAAGGGEIKVSAERNDELTIRVFDTGVGLSESNWERVFEPLVADPEKRIYSRLSKLLKDDDIVTLGRGSGLGLSIVRDIVRGRGGIVKFVRPKSPWKACVEVTLP